MTGAASSVEEGKPTIRLRTETESAKEAGRYPLPVRDVFHVDSLLTCQEYRSDPDAFHKFGQTALHGAAAEGHKDVVELLLADKADMNATTTTAGLTPLHEAASEGRRDVVELLLAKGARVDEKDHSGQTPLHYAAFWGRKDIAELLLANKADINAKDNKGETPFGVALAKGQNGSAEFLRQHGGHE